MEVLSSPSAAADGEPENSRGGLRIRTGFPSTTADGNEGVYLPVPLLAHAAFGDYRGLCRRQECLRPYSFRGDHCPLAPVLRGECLSGALYLEDFRRLLQRVGCLDYRVLSRRRINIGSADIEARIGMIDFYSVTVRAFKLADLEDRCEDYGQVATYLGGIEEGIHFFDLDDHHRFYRDKPMLVCGNTAAMLQETRYAPFFDVRGDRSRHFGSFACASGGSETLERGGACC